MKDTFRKLFGAAGAVAMAGLLVVAAPAGAASTDERIKALEAELQQVKTDQQRGREGTVPDAIRRTGG